MSTKSIYLIAYYYNKPKGHAKTAQSGWMKDRDNINYEEQIAVSNKLKKADLQLAKVILDLSNKTVYRNAWNDGKDFDTIFEHYYQGYQRYLDPVINQLGYEMVDKNQIEAEKLPVNETISSQ